MSWDDKPKLYESLLYSGQPAYGVGSKSAKALEMQGRQLTALNSISKDIENLSKGHHGVSVYNPHVDVDFGTIVNSMNEQSRAFKSSVEESSRNIANIVGSEADATREALHDVGNGIVQNAISQGNATREALHDVGGNIVDRLQYFESNMEVYNERLVRELLNSNMSLNKIQSVIVELNESVIQGRLTIQDVGDSIISSLESMAAVQEANQRANHQQFVDMNQSLSGINAGVAGVRSDVQEVVGVLRSQDERKANQLYSDAEKLREGGMYNEAIAIYSYIVSPNVFPSHFLSYFALIECYVAQNNWNNALHNYKLFTVYFSGVNTDVKKSLEIRHAKLLHSMIAIGGVGGELKNYLLTFFNLGSESFESFCFDKKMLYLVYTFNAGFKDDFFNKFMVYLRTDPKVFPKYNFLNVSQNDWTVLIQRILNDSYMYSFDIYVASLNYSISIGNLAMARESFIKSFAASPSEFSKSNIQNLPFVVTHLSNDIKLIFQNISEGNYTYDMYQGDFKNGMPNGKGKMIYSSCIHEGIFVDGKLNGAGKSTLSSGEILEGVFVNGKLNGEGKRTFSNGEVHEGVFVDSILNGIGEIIFSDANIRSAVLYSNKESIEGVFVNGKLNGEGKRIFHDGEVHEGNFVDSILNGIGKITLRGRNLMVGNHSVEYYMESREGVFVDGLLNGEGKVFIYDIISKPFKIYDGIFVNGKLTNGKLKIFEKVKEGAFVGDLLNGNGKISYINEVSKENMQVKEGFFVDDLLNGEGKITCSDGSLVEGMFVDDFLNGFGYICLKNGNYKKGMFKNGSLDGVGEEVSYHDNRGKRVKVKNKGVFENGEFVDTVFNTKVRKFLDFL